MPIMMPRRELLVLRCRQHALEEFSCPPLRAMPQTTIEGCHFHATPRHAAAAAMIIEFPPGRVMGPDERY